MGQIENLRCTYNMAKKHFDSIQFHLNEKFEKAFPVRSIVSFRKMTEGKIYRGVILRVWACGKNRKVRVRNLSTGSTYWIMSSWLTDENGKYFDRP